MRFGVVLVLLALTVPVQRPAGRVFVVSFDALGYERLTTDPVARELVTVRGLLESGAYAEGLTPAFPSTTANGHAALWTGTYVGRNGILYNSTPPLPRSEHTFTERVSGFRSDALTAEPIWLTAARQQIPVVAHQVTQGFPFTPRNVGAAPVPHLAVINGFQSRWFARWRAVRSTDPDVAGTSCDGWPAAIRADAVCYEWSLGKEAASKRLYAAARRDRIVIATSPGQSPIEVELHATEREPPHRRALARYWSRPLPIDGLVDNLPASLVFRALEIEGSGRTFMLLQSPLQETAGFSSDPDLIGAMLADTGPNIGNGATALYNGGVLGTPASSGGSGEAERRYLETLEVVVKQHIAQSVWLATRRQPQLHVTYLSTADDLDHAWYGLDRSGDKRYTDFRRWGYAALEHAARSFVALARPDDHVIITSDHGMAAVDHYFGVEQVLAQAGLSTMASTVNTCILLNTTDWKGGTIAPEARKMAIDRVRAALVAPRTPAGPIVTKIYASRSELAAFGHDGSGGADVCFDLAPGIGPNDRITAGTGMLAPAVRPVGMHGFDPTRADMKAVLLIRGPRATAGRNLGPLKSAVVGPLIADLLGIEPPREATAASPLLPVK
jgi:Type I phosphodiesterase / nucleotide pyrophosphatase